MRTNKLRSPIRPRKKGFDMFAKRFKRVRKSGLPQQHASCEILESRRHLAVTGNVSAGHTLSVIGDTNGQTITLSGSGSTIAVLANGVPISGSPFAGVTTAIYVSADSGADNVDVSAVTNGLPVTLLGGNGNDTLKGTTSADTFSGSNGDDSIIANGGNDSVSGGDGDDILYGDNGDDTLDGGTGGDDLHGGGGTDLADHSNRSTAISIAMDNIANDGSIVDVNAGGTRRDNIFTDVEWVFGTAYNDDMAGSELNDLFMGNGGNDSLYGLEGNDYLYGGIGEDLIWGMDGADVLFQNDPLNADDGLDDYVDQNQQATDTPNDGDVDHLWVSSNDNDIYIILGSDYIN